jgi:hypothetical protein
LDFPTIDRTNIVCFECELGLPPSKFLVSILNYIRCELVHLHPNTISLLSCFSMLCECWLSIPPDTSLFWYFYSPARYKRKVFSGIGLMLHCNCREEYMNVTYRGSTRSYTWGGAPRKQLHPHLHPLNLPSRLACLDVSSQPLCQLHKPAEPLGRFLLRPLERSPLRFGCEGITMPHHEDFLAVVRVRL